MRDLVYRVDFRLGPGSRHLAVDITVTNPNAHAVPAYWWSNIAVGIRQVHAGQSLISPPMASKLLAEFALMMKRQEEGQQMPVPRLTDRELQVLKLVARGMANKDIATDLFISENTVKNHVRNILEKLQLHSRMEAVMYAVRQKILELPE